MAKIKLPGTRRVSWPAILSLLMYASAYLASLVLLSKFPHFDTGESLSVMLVFGLGFSAIAWLASTGIKPADVSVARPRRESLLILAYLVFFAIFFLGWGLTAIRDTFIQEPLQSTVILTAKILGMVLLPVLLFSLLGYSPQSWFTRWRFGLKEWRVFLIMAAALALLQIVAGRGIHTVSALPQSLTLILLLAPMAFIRESLEAGLCEEFLFRNLLQERFTAWLRSPVSGILIMAVIFGLVHAPGYYLRDAFTAEGMTQRPDILTAMAYSIAVVSPLGIMFGVLWMRTRNLLLVVLLHGWTDLFPNLAGFVQIWAPN
ncbi:MAG: CPBP family intramembrane glutamic endopeptidase [Lysobacterales bacterium]